VRLMGELDALLAALTAENEVIERLIELGEAKQAAFQNAEKVAAIFREEEACLIRLDALEGQRLAHTEALVGDMTGAGLVEQLGPEGVGVQKLLEKLAENVKRLQEINDLNQELLRESLQYVQFSLNALSGDVAITYDRTGSTPQGTSTFDRKV
jgi:flagellar biosynthesis/type III secretory pathway chaperone